MTTRFSSHGFRRKALKIALALLVGLFLLAAGLVLAYLLTDIPGPAGSGSFGATVTVLSNGNFVVTDSGYDAGAVIDVGAVYLYNGATRQLISTLVGSQSGDQVSSGGVTVLSNGNYVVGSPSWANGAVANAGAVTWCSGTVGCTGVVTTTNSLVGSQVGDQVGGGDKGGVTALSNGNYVVYSPSWANGAASDAGAATWCSGTAGCTGVVSAANSLVGSQANDQVGGSYYGVKALSNGNYVVISWYWANGAVANAGAVTWCSGTAGCTGVVSAANSLVGSQAFDGHESDVIALSNGNYLVGSPNWDNGTTSDAGAATWCSGAAGCTGVVTTTNSLVGSQANDRVGDGVGALSNGNYVVNSNSWDNGARSDVGAVTWCSGTAGCTGVVTTTNSLVGSQAWDYVGLPGVTALSNGNYVVRSSHWDNGVRIDVGAATWCSGAAGCTGVVTTTNSLVGSRADDNVGYSVIALSNGNYVVRSPNWDNGGASDAGAATWCNGMVGCIGAVSTANSLVGSQTYNYVYVTALNNGNYVVSSRYWANGAASNAGAVTWCSGTLGCTGVLSATNSLVGSQANDQVGVVTALNNGNYVVGSRYWDNGGAGDAGAATWCSGTVGCTGVVTTTNSLVGSQANDQVGYNVTALSDGNYVVSSPNWDNGASSNSGAVTPGNGATGTVGPITSANSVLGTAANGGAAMVFDYGSFNGRLVVGRPADNIVSIFEFFQAYVYLPLVRK